MTNSTRMTMIDYKNTKLVVEDYPSLLTMVWEGTTFILSMLGLFGFIYLILTN